MSIHVTDFKWEKGENDLEYIALLEKNIDVMTDKFRECSKIAREQYNKGYEKGKADGKSKTIDEVIALARAEIDFESQEEQQRFVEFMEQLKEKK